MKKIILGLSIGIVVGGTLAWLVLRNGETEKGAAPVSVATHEEGKPAVAGLTFATPESATISPETVGYGRVLDPAPFLGALADLESARASATASAQEFARVKKLHEENTNASTQAVETADAARRRDQVQLASAQGRLLTGWGPALAGRSDLRGFARTLAAGEVALVRIDVPPADVPAASPVGARVAPLSDNSALQEVELLGSAPAADPQVQGRGYFALWRGTPAPSGTALRAVLKLPGESRKVLVLPRGAFVRHQGAVFVYVQKTGGACERRLVTLGPALERGLVVAEGVGEKDRVVVTGAQQLLAAELLGATVENGD